MMIHLSPSLAVNAEDVLSLCMVEDPLGYVTLRAHLATGAMVETYNFHLNSGMHARFNQLVEEINAVKEEAK